MTRVSLRDCLIATLFAGLVYLNALDNPFVYDDYRTIVDNGSITTLTNAKAIALHDASRPIVNLSYAIDRRLWGTEPLGFHVTNVLLHMLNVVFLYVLARKTAGLSVRPGIVAFVAASLFAVHPMMTEGVAYISGRSEVLCATWFLAAMLCAIRWMTSGGTLWWVLTAVLWIASLLTKEIGAMFPFVLVLYDRLLLGGTAADHRRRLMRLHVPLFAFGGLAVVARLTAFALLEHPEAIEIQWRAIFAELNVVARYIGLMFVPSGQGIFHDVPSVRSLLSVQAWWGAAVVAIVTTVAWRIRRATPLASVGIFWFLLLLVPSSALVVLSHGEGMAEHRVYLASCGLFLMAGSVAGWIVSRTVPAEQRIPLIGYALLAAALFPLSGRTLLRNTVWESAITLWREAAERAPTNPLPRTVYAESLHIAGFRPEALEQYRVAMQLDPHEDSLYLKLGMCLAELGRFDEAFAVFENLRHVVPDSPIISTGTGIVAMLAGDAPKARANLTATIEKYPRDIMARQWLAVLEEEVAGNPAEALRLCEEVRQIAPGRLSDDECVRRNRARLAAISAGS